MYLPQKHDYWLFRFSMTSCSMATNRGQWHFWVEMSPSILDEAAFRPGTWHGAQPNFRF